jgi:hypothetical protein
VTQSLFKPLTLLKKIQTAGICRKILRMGHELVLGGIKGSLEVFDISTATITHSCCIREDSNIFDIVAID